MENLQGDSRFDNDQPVAVTNLEEPGMPVPGRLVNFSANGTRMLLRREMNRGTMVKVDLGGTILLGEIISCTPQGEEFTVSLELEDAVYEMDQLESVFQEWVAQGPGRSRR